MQILGLGKVRIMRFSGRKGELEGDFVGIRSRHKGQRTGERKQGEGDWAKGIGRRTKSKENRVKKRDSGYYRDKKHKIAFY